MELADRRTWHGASSQTSIEIERQQRQAMGGGARVVSMNSLSFDHRVGMRPAQTAKSQWANRKKMGRRMRSTARMVQRRSNRRTRGDRHLIHVCEESNRPTRRSLTSRSYMHDYANDDHDRTQHQPDISNLPAHPTSAGMSAPPVEGISLVTHIKTTKYEHQHTRSARIEPYGCDWFE